MDPLSRKLFQSRDAREKLRQQGGIMASSPELAQTVAKFANGGPTELQIPRVRSAIQEGGMSYPSYRMLSRGQKRELGYPVSEIGGQLAFDRFGVGMGLVDRDARFTPSGLNVSEVRPDPTGMGRNMPRELEAQLNVLGISPEDAAQLTPDELDAIINDPTRAMRNRTADMPELPDTAPDTAFNRLVRPGQVARREVEDAKQLDAATDRAEAIRLMTGDDAYSAPEEAPVAPEDDAPKKDDPLTTLNETRNLVESEEFDFDTSYEKALERFQRILGDESDEDKRKKAMANMAMIGLAIAAGQSPDALTNIAQGALVGLKGIQEAEAADKQSAKEVRLAALKATMDRETRIREAEAEAAKGTLEFGRKLTLEEAKARLRAKYGDGSGGRNARALPDFVQNVFSKALEAAQSGTAVDMVEGEDPISYATRVADRAALDQQIRFPDTYGTSPQVKAMVDSQLKSNKSKEQVRAMLLEVFPNIDPSLYGL